MTPQRLTSCIVLIGVLVAPVSARAQLFGGVTGAWAASFDGSVGVGGMLGYDLPILPVDIFGEGTWFFPDCDGCDLKGLSLGVNVRLPLLLVRPYLTGGMTWRDLKDPDAVSIDTVSESGGFAGAGVDLAVASLRLFLEGRYELLDGDLEQAVVRMGVMVR